MSYIYRKRTDKTTNDKYELLPGDTIEIDGHRLYRIRALKSFSDVKKGDLGGYVESEENLCVSDDSWIYDETTWAYDNAKIHQGATLRGYCSIHGTAEICSVEINSGANIAQNAIIRKNRDYLTITGLGDRNLCVTFYQCNDGDIGVSYSHNDTSISTLQKDVKKKYGEQNMYTEEYLKAIELARIHFFINENEGYYKVVIDES